MRYQKSIANLEKLVDIVTQIKQAFSCADCAEDEYHFILVCPVYANFCRKYIKEYYCKRPSMFKLFKLFNTENYITMSNLDGKVYFK